MTPIDRRHALLRRLAWMCAVTVLAVVSLSAFIRLSNAGLGCNEWPACYGANLRAAQQGAAPSVDEQTATAVARLVHRITASLALLLVLTMVAVCLAAKPLMWNEGLLALAVLALAIFLAVLGRWSSGARVPAVAMGNLVGGMVMLALCVRLAMPGASSQVGRGLRVWAIAAALLLVGQVALGGLVSASFSGLSCTGLGGCGLAEAAASTVPQSLDPWREPVLDAATPGNPAGVLAHSLHRHAGLLLGVLLVALGALAMRRGRPRTGVAVIVLLVAQVAAGAALTVLALPLGLALLHNLLAAALLAAVISLT